MPKRLPSAEGAKRHPLNMRTTEATRLRLEEAARKSGRSLAQEVEASLEHYFYIKDDLELFNKPILRTIALALKQSELNTGKDWYEDEPTAQKFRNTLVGIMDIMFPFMPLSNLIERCKDGDYKDDILYRLDAADLAIKATYGIDNSEAEKVHERILTFNKNVRDVVQKAGRKGR